MENTKLKTSKNINSKQKDSNPAIITKICIEKFKAIPKNSNITRNKNKQQGC